MVRRNESGVLIRFYLSLVLICVWINSPDLLVLARSQTQALRIVVLEGEDAVNIIRQNTAVKPIIEVRDSNNLPVSGATVQFTMPSTGAGGTFANGSRIFSITTDAAGRATTSEVTLQGTGSFRIQVSATHQGQNATATITQTTYRSLEAAVAAGRSIPIATTGGTAATGAAATGGTAATGAGAGTAAVATGAGMSAGAVTGIAAGVAVAGVAGQTKVGAKADCGDIGNVFVSSASTAQQLCFADQTQASCRTSVQKALNDWGQLCSCVGSGTGVQFVLTRFGISQSEYESIRGEAIAQASQQGFILPASCGF